MKYRRQMVLDSKIRDPFNIPGEQWVGQNSKRARTCLRRVFKYVIEITGAFCLK